MNRQELSQAVREIVEGGKKKKFYLSLYLNTNDKDPNQNKKTGAFLRKGLRTLDKSLPKHGELRDFYNAQKPQILYEFDNLSPGNRGVFFLSNNGSIKKIEVKVPFKKTLVASFRPQIFYLEELLARGSDLNILLVDSRESKFFAYSLGEVEFKEKIIDSVPDRVKSGGWSQMKIERHIEDHISSHFKNTAKRVEHIHEFESKSDWLILGQHDIVVNFLKYLSTALKGKVVGTLEMDLRSNVNDIALAAERLIFSEDSRHKKEEIKDLNNLRSKGLFVWGIADILKYANNNAIEKLLIGDDFEQPGYYCPQCDMLEINPCSCGNISIKEINLAEALLQKIIKNEAEVEFLDSEDLQEYGGVAAKLRFAL